MPSRRRFAVLAVALLCLPAVAVAAADDGPDEAAVIYQKLRPSTVSISNDEGSGTGIVLDDTGLILTCAHVVTSPVAYKVKIDTSTTDEPKTVTYDHVTIVGFHPDRDLALIRIDPREPKDAPKLVPAVVSRDKAHSGQRIYAIGDPGAGSQVMTKTITQGIVSGVDRVFDDQKFYQIDAAVNPGNSGGPVVDHLGRVLGIVTFQFNDLQALNFAIPLQEIDFAKFVPLTEHKANPHRAGVLERYARDFAAEADKAARDQGPDSDDARQKRAYAAYCFEEALVYDPSNPDLYDDIGTEYVTAGRDDAAVAYLVRAVELQPWDPPSANPYRQMGRAFRDQGQDTKAMAAWDEGLAKFPYAAGIWDDLAFYHLDKNDYVKAAYSASIALACNPRPARVAKLQKLLRSAKDKLDDADAAKVNSSTAHDAIVGDLDQMRQKSNRARKRRSLYVTAPFVMLMKTSGTLDVPGVEDRIPQTPLLPPAKLAVGDDASVAVDDPPAPAAPKPPAKGGPKHPANPDQDDETSPDNPPAQGQAGGGDQPPPPTPKSKKHVPHPSDGDGGNAQPKGGNRDDDTPGSGGSKRQAQAAAGGGDDWLGTKAKPTSPGDVPVTQPATPAPNVILPRPAVTGIDLAGQVQTVDDAKVVPVDVDDAPIGDVVLSADAAAAFVVQKDGLVRKVALPSLKEERQIDLGSPVGGAGVTRDGLAVAVSNLNEVWLLDPATLEVKGRVALAGVTRLATSPNTSAVLAAMGPDAAAVLEPDAGTVAARYKAADLATAGKLASVAFDHVVMAPDGHHLYLDADGRLAKFGLSGGVISFQAAGPKVGVTVTALMVSPDGRYVAMPCHDGNDPVGAGAAKQPFATYVFRAADLATPVMTLATGPTPGPLAFDGVARQLYGQSDTRQLIVFAPTGERTKDYMVVPNTTTQKLLVTPTGRRLFVLAGGKLVWVTLP